MTPYRATTNCKVYAIASSPTSTDSPSSVAIVRPDKPDCDVFCMRSLKICRSLCTTVWSTGHRRGENALVQVRISMNSYNGASVCTRTMAHLYALVQGLICMHAYKSA